MLTRRAVLVSAVGVAAGAAGAAPVSLNIVDVAGNLQLTKVGIERFRMANPSLVSHIGYSSAPSPELPGKLKAQQRAGRVDIDLVLTGPGALSEGVTQGLWTQLLPDLGEALPDLDRLMNAGAQMMQANFGEGQGVAVVYSPSGPLFEYMPDRVSAPLRTAQDLLAWVRAHPNRFTYARPYNSEPGSRFLQGMPYVLGDSDPKDPLDGWDKTWAYLAALGEHIDYYPDNTAATMKELGKGTRDIIVSTCGWDINRRVLGVVPKEAGVFMLEGTHWLPDAQFMCIPKGVEANKIPVLMKLMNFLLQPEQQALTYDRGYFYPGPVSDVALSQAPVESQDVIREYGRPVYDKWIAELPVETPLMPDRLVAAFRRWDEKIGSKATRR
jgi:putative spermidine/putrescine transport system substrate-binding protein